MRRLGLRLKGERVGTETSVRGLALRLSVTLRLGVRGLALKLKCESAGTGTKV